MKIKQAARDVVLSNCRFENTNREFGEYPHPALRGAIQINNNEGAENICVGIVAINNEFINRCDEPMNAIWVRTRQQNVPQGHFQFNHSSGAFVEGTVNFEPDE